MLSIKAYSLLVLLALLLACPQAWATIRNVSNESGLYTALSQMQSGDQIVLAAGNYHVTSVININIPNITLRGATGNRDDVVLYGEGMNAWYGAMEGIAIGGDDVTVRDLTVKGFCYNGIHIRAESDADRTHIDNVKTWNIGERHIKGSWSAASGLTADNAIIENCYMLQDEARLDGLTNQDYVGGLDAMGITNWIVRDNVMNGIQGGGGDARGAIFMWVKDVNPLVENNIIFNCDRGIAMGNTYNPDGRFYAEGGIVRNNFIYGNDQTYVMELDHTKDLKVYNNTIINHDAARRTIMIFDNAAAPTTNLDLRNNIVRGAILDQSSGVWTAATVAAMTNIVGDNGSIPDSWFADIVNGDLHLANGVTAPLGAGVYLPEVLVDIDGAWRTNPPDIGADQVSTPEPATLCLLALGMGMVLRRRRG